MTRVESKSLMRTLRSPRPTSTVGSRSRYTSTRDSYRVWICSATRHLKDGQCPGVNTPSTESELAEITRYVILYQHVVIRRDFQARPSISTFPEVPPRAEASVASCGMSSHSLPVIFFRPNQKLNLCRDRQPTDDVWTTVRIDGETEPVVRHKRTARSSLRGHPVTSITWSSPNLSSSLLIH
jgi:hypothetical protein